MSPIKGTQLALLAAKLRARDALQPEEVGHLLDRALKDQALQPEEAKALRELLPLDDDEIGPDARTRLERFLAIEHTDLQALAHALTADDGVLSASDAARVRDLVLADGEIDDKEKISLGALMVASKLGAGAEAQLSPLAQGRVPTAETQRLLRRLACGEITLADLTDPHRSDRDFVLIALARDPRQIVHLGPPLGQDEAFLVAAIAAVPEIAGHLQKPIESRAVLEAAIAVDGDHFSKGSEALQQDLPLARRAAANGYWIGGTPLHLRDDRAFVLANIQQHPSALNWASDRLATEKSLAIEAVRGGYGVGNLAPALQQDRDIALAAMQKYGHRLGQLDERFRADPEVVHTAVANDWRALYDASPALKADRDLVALAVARSGKALYAADPAFRADRELVLKAFDSGDFSLADADPALRADRDVVMAAVQSDRDALESADAALQGDTEVARAAIGHWAKAFNAAAPPLRGDADLALLALEKASSGDGGDLDLDPSLLADRDFLERAVAVRPSVLSAADDRLRRDPDLVRLAVTRDPEALTWAHESLRADPDYVGELIDALGGAVFSYASHSVRGNRELLDRALDDCVEALRWASPELKGDREIVRKAIAAKGGAIEWATDELRKDKELALLAIPVDPWAFWEIDAELKQDPDVVALSGACFPRSLDLKIPDALKADAELLERLARANPLTFEQMDASQQKLVLERYPGVEAEYRLRHASLVELDIEFPHRFRPLAVLDEIIANRQQPRQPADDRPAALMIYNKNDHNGAFSVDNFSQLVDHYRILYYEAETDTDVRAALHDVATRGERAELVVLAGHGTREQTAMGASDPAGDGPLDDELFYVDIGDRAELERDLQRVTADGADVVLESCSTGEGRGSGDNVANLFAAMLPGAAVHAPVQPTNNRIKVDASGRFVDAGFWGGRAETYRAG